MKALIAGGGKALFFICRNLAARGCQIVVINGDSEECVQLARQLPATVICGDASDAEILGEAGARQADVVLAITPNDQDNLVICQLAARTFGAPRTVALANDPDNVELFEKLGVTGFSITNIVGSLIEQRAALEQITNLLPLGDGRVNVTEIVIDERSPVAGKFLRDIVLPENALVAVVIRGERPIVPRGANDLLVGDRVVLITLPENHGPALRALVGQQI
ncbi:TrkA-N domain protein [Desulfarculus baarsii DSM 2075]|uniref:Trk system potassium uptake protein TrkA n=1 Tax=Desulfarculus baarsii (strain ATCC 33931 / DSM 2075 / LMG 7858 / VKM B-1802 / 2st14) TaxID=644282 RepID=E1QH82_DESB2|nr:NAD-binding protein [Desulfarculus baarsii]ADK84925.1 TrkA-N domain protein [Desulfarculus baarsii DSM 2075]